VICKCAGTWVCNRGPTSWSLLLVADTQGLTVWRGMSGFRWLLWLPHMWRSAAADVLRFLQPWSMALFRHHQCYTCAKSSDCVCCVAVWAGICDYAAQCSVLQRIPKTSTIALLWLLLCKASAPIQQGLLTLQGQLTALVQVGHAVLVWRRSSIYQGCVLASLECVVARIGEVGRALLYLEACSCVRAITYCRGVWLCVAMSAEVVTAGRVSGWLWMECRAASCK
jgi:hypothetical protein